MRPTRRRRATNNECRSRRCPPPPRPPPPPRLADPQAAGASCLTFSVCHESQGLAFTSVALFTALEPLFDQLGLGGYSVNDYVTVRELDSGCLAGGCCCSTPVEVQLALPAAAGRGRQQAARLAAGFVADRLPRGMAGAKCTASVKASECAAAPAVPDARRRLM